MKLMFITFLQDLSYSRNGAKEQWNVDGIPPVYDKSRREITDRRVLGCPGIRCSELALIHRSAA